MSKPENGLTATEAAKVLEANQATYVATVIIKLVIYADVELDSEEKESIYDHLLDLLNPDME
jgi:hypothetical protein